MPHLLRQLSEQRARQGQFPEPVELYRKSVGYGIIVFDKKTRKVTLQWKKFTKVRAKGDNKESLEVSFG